MKKILLAIILFLSSAIINETKCDFSSKISKEAALLTALGAYGLYLGMNPQKIIINDDSIGENHPNNIKNDPRFIEIIKIFGGLNICMGLVTQMHKINPSLLPNLIKTWINFAIKHPMKSNALASALYTTFGILLMKANSRTNMAKFLGASFIVSGLLFLNRLHDNLIA